ncbi:MAG: hypothetical protein WCI57_01015 [Candidatus Berkelbacteria bacterium]
MKKTSIFKILAKRKIVLSSAIFLGLAAAVLSGTFIFYRYFQPVKAANSCAANVLTVNTGATAKIVDNFLTGSITPCDNTNVSGYDITVSGTGVKLILAGYNTFKNISVLSNATITHEALSSLDIETDGASLLPTGEAKKVQMVISGTLTLDTGGKISADGLGYPGGTATHTAGFGFGGGQATQAALASTVILAFGPGGGAFGGVGGSGFSNPSLTAATGTAYPNYYDPYIFRAGSGSGYNAGHINTPVPVVGSSGGGRIYVRAGTINIKSGTISAKGSTGLAQIRKYTLNVVNRYSFTGGGAGGTIWLVADTIVAPKGATGVTPDVSGGAIGGDYQITTTNSADDKVIASAIHDGTNGVSEIFVDSQEKSDLYKNYFGYLSTAGGLPSSATATLTGSLKGTAAGGGGGGRIRVEAKVVRPSCTIISGTTIPDYCENGDVVVGNGLTINMDAVTVLQDSTRTLCTDPTISNCDSARHFNSLTLQGNAKLTHNPITSGDLLVGGTPYTTLQGDSLIKGAARWRKVDITVDDYISLATGSSIDVSEKGYTGSNNTSAALGRAAGATNTNQGGGYAGKGAGNSLVSYPPDFQTKVISGNFDYTSTYLDSGKTYPLFDAGSGAGTASAGGGGRIHLNAKSLTLAPGSSISANGTGVAASMAAGAGGMIWIDSQSYSFPSDLPEAVVTGGTGANVGENGYIYTDIFTPNLISANGGSTTNGFNGGGGRIIIHQTVATQNQPIITKSVKVVERPGMTGTAVTDLNPYALILDDVIEVTIAVTGLTPGTPNTTIDENVLAAPTGQYCSPISATAATPASPSTAPTISTGIKLLTWTFTPTNTSSSMTYKCRVVKS